MLSLDPAQGGEPLPPGGTGLDRAVPYFYLSAGFRRPLGETATFDGGTYFEGGIGKDLYLGKNWGLGVSAGLRYEQELAAPLTSETWGLVIGLSISKDGPLDQPLVP